MPTYLDAAVVRIQPYLARTPELRLRRGASWMITRATGDEAVDGWIRGSGLAGVARNQEAGHADGVVALTVPSGSAADLAPRLLLHLRAEMPGADLQAQWGQAATYLEFRRDRSHHGQGLLALPPMADFPLARTCASCRVDPCDSASDMCPDCTARDRAAGQRRPMNGTPQDRTVDGEVDALGSERMVINKVSCAVGRQLRPVSRLGQLAELGEEPGNRNHVATVALDGNGMGGFFTALAGQTDPTLKRRISPEISAATRDALISAALAVTRESDRHLAVVPHLVGGDDVVVSVTADRAWPFTRAFLARFSEALAAATGWLSLPDAVVQRLPSMSAGLVFSHYKFPYARAAGLAEQVLRRAKRDTYGAEPAIGWLDVTVDGEAFPAWHMTLAATQLDQQADVIAALQQVPPSSRQALARLLARGSEEEARAAALSWARRNNQPAATALLGRATITEVRNLVALTRWWRA